jgi:hypothetical protein
LVTISFLSEIKALASNENRLYYFIFADFLMILIAIMNSFYDLEHKNEQIETTEDGSLIYTPVLKQSLWRFYFENCLNLYLSIMKTQYYLFSYNVAIFEYSKAPLAGFVVSAKYLGFICFCAFLISSFISYSIHFMCYSRLKRESQSNIVE